MREELKTQFAKRLPALLVLRGLTIRGLAREAGLPHTTVTKLARGDTTPRVENAWKIATALNIKVSELVGS